MMIKFGAELIESENILKTINPKYRIKANSTPESDVNPHLALKTTLKINA